MSERLSDDQYRARAKQETRGYDWISFDANPAPEVLNVDDGAFVQAWIFVADPEEEE